ncbi:MAG TPA: RidA family protein [Chloroflexota bacterium]|nr:RidA family protein [Chloroflexota bacterium]
MAGRESIEIPGLVHGAPIPNGCRIGNMVFSSGIAGRDTANDRIPEDPDTQAAAMFDNVRTFMKNAGGSPDDIAYVKVYLTDEKYRDSVNKEWVKMFPDEHSRPARHAIPAPIRGGYFFQIELIAVL